ncbi:CBS domain-containing protein, partial [Balneolaceae bacterium ANBcel3]|nr:CBS domain-containing protein [Balneolaceae bacterium ANBcel3]
MHLPEDVISVDQPMQQVAQKFQNSNYYNLPVVDGKKYLGFVSRANVFSAYRKMLRTMTEE